MSGVTVAAGLMLLLYVTLMFSFLFYFDETQKERFTHANLSELYL